METVHALSALFDHAGCQFSIYDLGRRVCQLDETAFRAVEANQQPYPYPLRQHAHMAIAFWPSGGAPWVWFLKMPLDERGLLNHTAMGDFLQYVSAAMGERLTATPNKEQREKLANNPYTFTPTDDKMAMFHATLTYQLGRPASQYYDHAQHYLNGELGWDNWQGVGLQGLADTCVRMAEQNNATRVRKALNHLPTTPLYALLGCLEHCQINDKLAASLRDMFQQMCQTQEVDIFLVSALIRTHAGAPSATRHQLIDAVLDRAELHHREIFVAIAGRCWHHLTDDAALDRFLIALADQHDATLFQQVYADLVMLPPLRGALLGRLHGHTSPALTQAMARMQQAVKQTHHDH
ncbi:hypothetical protein BZG25_10720 [Salinivibrio sp. ML198]|uniref:DUF3549 family protein n=1 Tax=unclassified Salinivibrio TaxID=2636825 RepID=UPI00098428FF|nr:MULTISPECIES: DUF3549 family protein [unclassified Salinivibrio]OOE66202.1 hypothetical protein BZG20_09820 [Salinivibrio sp. IB868]OOE76131.1 hypothetical protein BZG22_04260 [Salinivibrio sp. IB870]OOE79065.1 hypothetical protein BZG25_10720 [Salinivibrio sp. ML198]